MTRNNKLLVLFVVVVVVIWFGVFALAIRPDPANEQRLMQTRVSEIEQTVIAETTLQPR